ncbi:MAG: tetratricopeptide repeat protein [Verrucomicrobiota bacterium]
MKAMQRCGPPTGTHRCIVAYTTALAFTVALTAMVRAEAPDEYEDFADLYVDQYFEPKEHLKLNPEGRKKGEALAYYALGRTFEAEGRVTEAVEAYLKVLENQPDQHFLARKTAYLLARGGSNDEALKLLEQNLENNPSQPFPYISLSEFLATYQANDPEGRERALEAIRNAVDRFPDEAAVYQHLVRLLLVQGKKDEARLAIEKAASRNNSDPAYWLTLGKIVGRTWPVRPNQPSRDAELLNRIYGRALEVAGEDWTTVELVADFYHATQQLEEAARTYRTVIDSNPDRLDVREKLARVYAGLNDQERVLETLEEIVEIDPGNAEVLKQIASYYIGQEDYISAVPFLEASLEISKGSQEEYSALGRMMIQADQDEAAVKFLEKAAYLFPDKSEFPFLLTFSLGRLERWEDSVKQFEDALKLGEEEKAEYLDDVFYFRFGAAHERAGNFDEAEQLFEKTIDLISKKDPTEEDQQFTATVYNYLGYMWLEIDKNIDAAGELIRTAADLDPESGAIADSLGWFYFKKGRYEEAREALLRAEELSEDPAAEILDHIGQVFHKLGDQQKAIEYLERAVALEPDNEDLIERLERYRAYDSGKPKPVPAEAKQASAEGKKAAQSELASQ